MLINEAEGSKFLVQSSMSTALSECYDVGGDEFLSY